eukprot:TRINITY_DN5075_c0_g1_i4.p1 TRINITY_DN5075_c0_g1~~TRINITY_DN5075_c0_g1_i4.p1  ORF type:complete len:241 (-),score=30.93 TRINITY_DN5075_c0_g1_i4:89-811(-)
MKKVFTNRFYWFLALQFGWVFLYNYFFISLVMSHMLWHGASKEEAKDYLYIWSVMLPMVGFTASLISGFIIDYERKSTMIGINILQIILLFLTCLGATLPSTPLWVQTLTFLFFIVWRVIGFSSFPAIIPCIFPDFQSTMAVTFVSSASGLVSVIIMPFVTRAVQENSAHFLPAHLFFCIFGALTSIFVVILFITDYPPKRFDDVDRPVVSPDSNTMPETSENDFSFNNDHVITSFGKKE